MGASCVCGAALHPRPCVATDDWTWHDDEGRAWVPLPAIPWDELREGDVATYSRLAARQALGMLSHVHVHRPVRVEPYDGPIPFCCGEPMRAAPSGWRCRAGCE